MLWRPTTIAAGIKVDKRMSEASFGMSPMIGPHGYPVRFGEGRPAEGRVPGIHRRSTSELCEVDARDKPAQDDEEVSTIGALTAASAPPDSRVRPPYLPVDTLIL